MYCYFGDGPDSFDIHISKVSLLNLNLEDLFGGNENYFQHMLLMDHTLLSIQT